MKKMSFSMSHGVKGAIGVLMSPGKTIRSVLSVSLFRNTLYLLIQSVVNSATGFAFWAISARAFPAEEVGIAYALTSTLVSLAFLGTLGQGMGIIRFLPDVPSPKRLVNSSLTVTLIASVIVSMGFVGGLSLWSPRLLFLRAELAQAAGFAVFVVASAFGTIVIQTYVGLRRSEFALFYTVISVARLLFLLIFGRNWGAYGIFAAWGLAELAAVAVSLVIFLRRVVKNYVPSLDFEADVLKGMVSFTSVNFVGDVLRGIPSWVLPLLVLNVLSATENAYFGASWTIAGAVLLVPSMTSLTLVAEGSQVGARVGGHIGRSLKMNLLILVPVALVLCVFGDKILLIMGKDYSGAGGELLWLLAPAAIPAAINMLYVSVLRVEKRLGLIILVMGGIAVITLALSWVLIPRMGLMGAGVGWLSGQTAVAVVASFGLARRVRAEASRLWSASGWYRG